MAKLDKDNHAKYWVDPDLAGVSLLRAAFGTLSFAPHIHDELVIAVTEGGAGRCISRGVAEIGTARSIMVFNPGEPHSGGVVGAKAWRYRGLYLNDRILQLLRVASDHHPGATPYFRSMVVEDPALAALLVAAHETIEQHEARLARESLFLAALVKLIERHGAREATPPPLGHERGPVQRALGLMRANFADDLSLDDLAACAALSPFHFVRSFRRATGLPPHAYLTQLRLDRARALLVEGRSATDVALAVGFYDQSHLTKHFKRAYGITPGQYAAAHH
jgi:AraC-like DNA-binding protein